MFDDLPDGLIPKYANEVNKSILLYDGKAILHSLKKGDVEGECKIFFSWTPFTCTKFFFQLPATYWMANLLEQDFELHIANLRLCSKVKILSFKGGKEGNRISGMIENPIRFGNGNQIKKLNFHMANLPEMIGSPIKRGNAALSGRINLSNGPWKIVLDEVPETIGQSGLTMREELKTEKGFAITHVGQIERNDGNLFDVSETDSVMTNLGRTMSFANSINTYPILKTGFDNFGNEIWNCWTSYVVDHFETRLSWFSEQQPAILQSAFDGWVRLESSSDFEVIKAALGLFLDAEKKGLTSESRLVIVQAALEGLSTGWSFPSLPNAPAIPKCDSKAAENMFKIIVSLGLPIDVPSNLKELYDLEHPKDKNDPGAVKIAWIRNSIAHLGNYPRLKGQRKVVFQAFKLAIWYLELALLRLLDANGLYTNRITAIYFGEAQKLPWIP